MPTVTRIKKNELHKMITDVNYPGKVVYALASTPSPKRKTIFQITDQQLRILVRYMADRMDEKNPSKEKLGMYLDHTEGW
jgi:hypothetical protein